MTIAQIHVELLRDRIAMLEEENLQLREQLKPTDNPFYGRAGLTPQLAVIACLFWRNADVSYQRLDGALSLHSHEVRGEDPEFVYERSRVAVCKLRHLLAPYGIKIQTVRGFGYRMTTEDRKKLGWLAYPKRSHA